MEHVDTADEGAGAERTRLQALARAFGLGLARSLAPSHLGAAARWHYEEGFLLGAIRAAGLLWDAPELARGVDETVASFVTPGGDDGGSSENGVRIRGYRKAEYNLDQINPGKNLFPLLERPDGARFRSAIELLRGQLSSQPRTPSGGYWHKLIYPDQMWLDGLFMAEPFFARYAATFGEPGLFAHVASQFSIAEKAMRDPATGLLHHGWDESRRQKWADPATGLSPHFWGRAIGWFAMALVDCLEWIPRPDPESRRLADILARVAAAMAAHQDPVTGLWWQVVDEAGRDGNYLEASVSAMMSYSLAKAVRLDFLPAMPYRTMASRAYAGCVDHFLRRDDAGEWHFEGTCAVAGLGGNPYRDGSFSYYIGEPVRTDDCKGAAPFILAAMEQWLREGA